MTSFLAILLSAFFLIQSFPKANLEIFAWIAFVPLFFAVQNKKPIHAFLVSYLCGVLFFAGITYWLVNVTFMGFVLLVMYLALYFGIFGLIFAFTRERVHAFTRLLFIPSVWVLLEYVRSHLFTGFGWALLGYSQYLNLPIIQIADITGCWGVSFLIMMVNVSIYSVIGYRLALIGKKQKTALPTAYYVLTILFLSVSLAYGFYKLYRTPDTANRKPIKISVIQGNIPQELKWQEAAKDRIVGEYLRLSRLAASDNPDMIVWPEAALPEILKEGTFLKEDIKTFIKEVKIPLLVGAIISEGDNYYNCAILVSKEGKIIQRYNKLHLVPFGEYIPLKKALPFLQVVVPIGDFTAGSEYTAFLCEKQQALRFSALICFEDIFAQISRQFVKRGADFLINITNDAWFADTASPYQHLQASIFRAVENGVYLVRAANTGISGFITPEGRVYPLFDHDSGKQTFISGYLSRDIFPGHKQYSIYTQWGDWFILICFVIAINAIIKYRVQKSA